MKRKIFFLSLLLSSIVIANAAYGQGIAINTSGASADTSAMLDVASMSKGLLAPRMTSTQRGNIALPATGLLVYQTDAPEGFYYNSSGGWIMIPSGSSSSSFPFADFYALMPPDNAATVAVGGDVSFPEDGPSSGEGDIARTGSSSFLLAATGTYQVMFQVSVNEPGQLELTLNSSPLAYTVVGRATGTSQITGVCLVTTITSSSLLTVRNPASNSTALTITPLAGGSNPSSAHLVITQLQ